MASARKRDNGKYMALYRDADGKQKSAGSYPTKGEALKAARRAEATGHAPIKYGNPYPISNRGKITVAKYSSQWLPSHALASHSRYVYEQILRVHILPELGTEALSDITVARIRQWFRKLEAKGTSMALGKKIKTVLSAMFQGAAEDGLIPANVVRGVTFKAAPPKRRRALTADDWFRVRRYLTGEYRLLCDVVVATGARIEEAMGMEGRDVTGTVWTISRVRNQVAGVFSTKDYTKTGHDRQVRLPDDLAARIRERGPRRIFSDFKLDTFRQCAWYPACRMAGLDWQPAPRDLRRTFATLARANGAKLESVQAQLGHTRLATTDIYLGEQPGASDDAYEAIQRAMKSPRSKRTVAGTRRTA